MSASSRLMKARRATMSLQERCDDLKRALSEHNPKAKIAACGCGNIALAFVEDHALGLRYARCLVCGTNVSLQFVDVDVEHAAPRFTSEVKLTKSQLAILLKAASRADGFVSVTHHSRALALALRGLLRRHGFTEDTCTWWRITDAGRAALRDKS